MTRFAKARNAFRCHSLAMLKLAATEPPDATSRVSLFGHYAGLSAWLAASPSPAELKRRWAQVATDPEYADGIYEDDAISLFLP